MSGENFALVGKLLGYQRHRTTAGYALLADAHLVRMAEKLGEIIADAMRGKFCARTYGRLGLHCLLESQQTSKSPFRNETL